MALKIIGGFVVAAIIAIGINWLLENVRLKNERKTRRKK